MKPKPTRREAIDWPQVRERLARATTATEQALRLSPERGREVMEQRARDLARVPDRATPAEVLEAVIFTLGNERFALETCHVREVVRLRDLTPLPGAPDFLLGVTSLRGHILAVIDLRRFFGIAGKGLTDLNRVIVLGGERAELGVLADTASEVIALRRDQVLEPPGSVAGVARAYLRGVTAEALLVLDGAVLLRDPRLIIDQGQEGGAETTGEHP
jgi:purine-binding chemotaxis protein CheW